MALGDRAMLCLECLASRPCRSRSSRAAQNGAGLCGRKAAWLLSTRWQAETSLLIALVPGGARAAPLRPQGLRGLPGAALAHPPRGAVGLGHRCAPPPPQPCRPAPAVVPRGVGRALASQFCPPNPAQPQIRAASLLCSSLFLLLLPQNEQLMTLGVGKCLIVVN